MRQVAAPGHRLGRWLWGASGLVTVLALAIPGTWLIISAGVAWHARADPQHSTTLTDTVPQPVTSLDVRSYGAPVQVTAGPVRRVRVTETILYGQWTAKPPAVTQSVSGGRLTLADPACAAFDCAVSFAVTVPPDVAVTVTSDGGPVGVTGTGGPLTVTTNGGPLLTQGIAAATVRVSTAGGQAQIGFAAPPDSAAVNTDGGPAMLLVPGGTYALTADSGGGPENIGIATDPTARRSIDITSGGGPLWIEPEGQAELGPLTPVPPLSPP